MNKVFFVVFLGILVGAMALIFFNQTATAPIVPAGTGTVAEAPAPAKPEPPKSEPAKPETAKPEPAEPEPAKPEPVKPEPTKPEPAKPVPPTTEPAKPESAKPEPTKPEPAKPVPPTTELAKTEPPKTEPAKPVTPAPVKKSLALKNISLQFKKKGMALRIEADGGFSYKTFALSSPERYVVDLGGSWSGMRVPTIPSNSMVKGARVGSQASGPRLVLDLQRAPKKHRVTWVAPTVLEIYLE
jgi:outer membrane biosynthesis protein TonB